MEYIQQIQSLLGEWNKALQSGDPDRVTALYSFNAVLLPTLSARVRCGQAEIRDYFQAFLARRPLGISVEQSNIRVYGDIAIDSGIYLFEFSETGEESYFVRARFTFVYHWFGDRWLIVEHHSSLMPEE